jgi:hypothetical protein
MSPNVKNGHLEYWEGKAVKKADTRRKKGKPKMKVSGAGVKQLAKIIAKKTDG